MNKLSEKELFILHEKMIVGMFGPYARITDDEWNHAMGVLENVLVEMEKMGFVSLEGYDFGEEANE
ncbi:MAG: hypothetical protein ACYSW6_11240 [Planctomycetota bacterium]|jgi:hypothetical protein